MALPSADRVRVRSVLSALSPSGSSSRTMTFASCG